LNLTLNLVLKHHAGVTETFNLLVSSQAMKNAAIQRAKGQKQAAILQAEGQKTATIAIAQLEPSPPTNP
jgi:regulator of protease activity HflC (stomatin/prohibitin superfamily)